MALAARRHPGQRRRHHRSFDGALAIAAYRAIPEVVALPAEAEPMIIAVSSPATAKVVWVRRGDENVAAQIIIDPRPLTPTPRCRSAVGAFVQQLAEVVGSGSQVAFPPFLVGVAGSGLGAIELLDDPVPGKHARFDAAGLGEVLQLFDALDR